VNTPPSVGRGADRTAAGGVKSTSSRFGADLHVDDRLVCLRASWSIDGGGAEIGRKSDQLVCGRNIAAGWSRIAIHVEIWAH